MNIIEHQQRKVERSEMQHDTVSQSVLRCDHYNNAAIIQLPPASEVRRGGETVLVGFRQVEEFRVLGTGETATSFSLGLDSNEASGNTRRVVDLK